MLAERGLLRRFAGDRRGTTGIIFALTTLVVIGIMGMGIDLGRAMVTTQRMQSALDNAVLAAASVDPAEREAVAGRYFNANFQNGGSVPVASATAKFSTAADGGVTGSVEVSLQTTFMQLFQIGKLDLVSTSSVRPGETTTKTVTETKTVTKSTPGSVPCIMVQDENDRHALRLISNSSVDARNCEIHVGSNDRDAILTDSESNVKWKRIRVRGSGGTMLSGRDTIMAAPNKIEFDQPINGDPFFQAISDVAKELTVDACTKTNTGKSFTGTISPGTYCGSTTFNGVTFNPGVYIIASDKGNTPGLLTMKGRLNGKAGVTFYFADNKARIASFSASEESVLTAPTEGVTRGILFFEGSNRGQTWDLSMSSLSKVFFNGVIYLPSVNLTMHSWSADEGQKMAFAMVVNTLEINSWSGITNTYEWIPFNRTSPIRLPGETTTETVTETRTVTETQAGWLAK